MLESCRLSQRSSLLSSLKAGHSPSLKINLTTSRARGPGPSLSDERYASAIAACTRCTRSGSRNTLRGLRRWGKGAPLARCECVSRRQLHPPSRPPDHQRGQPLMARVVRWSLCRWGHHRTPDGAPSASVDHGPRIDPDTIGHADVMLPASGSRTLYARAGDWTLVSLLLLGALPIAFRLR
jgi:hypothetical protein